MANIKATTIITSLIKNNIHNVIYDYSREIKNLNDKINTLMNNTYTKAEVDNLIANLSVNPSPSIDLSNYYTINEVQQLFLSKADAANNYYTKKEVGQTYMSSAGVATYVTNTLSDYYTKDDMSRLYMPKAGVTGYVDSSIKTSLGDYYKKTEIDQKLANISSGGTVDLSGYATINQLNNVKNKAWGTGANIIGVFASGNTLYLQDDCLSDFATDIHDGDTVDSMENAIASYGAIKYFQIGCIREDDEYGYGQPEMLALSAFNLDGDDYLVTDTYINAKFATVSMPTVKMQKKTMPGKPSIISYAYNNDGYIGIGNSIDGDKIFKLAVAQSSTDYTSDENKDALRTLVTKQYLDEKYYTADEIDAINTTDIEEIKQYYAHNKQHYVTIEWDDKNSTFSNIPVSDYSSDMLLTGTVEDGALLVKCAANYTLNFDFINVLNATSGKIYNFRLDCDNYEIDPDIDVYPRFRLILSCKDTAYAAVNYIVSKGWYLNNEYIATAKTVAVNPSQKVLLDIDLVLMNITTTTITDPSSRILTYTTTDNKIWTPSSNSWYESNTYSNNNGTIIIKDGVVNTTTDMSKFYNLSGDNLKTINIPNAVGMVGYGEKGMYLFKDCPNLTSVTLGNKLNTLGYLFYNCPSLSEVYVKTGGNAFADNSKYLMSKDGKQLYWGVNADGIPNTVTIIRSGAFSHNQNNRNVILQNNIVTIQDSAFCSNEILTDFEIGSSVKSIGNYCFVGCVNLTNVHIDAGTPPIVTSITFVGLKDQLTIKVPASAYNTYISNNWENYATIISDAGTPEISHQDKIDVMQIVDDKKSTDGYVTYITSDQTKQSTDIRETATSKQLSELNHTFTATPCKHGEFELPLLAEWPYTLFSNGNKVTVMGIYAQALSMNSNSSTFANMQNLKLLYINCISAWAWPDAPGMFGDNYDKIVDGTLTVYANSKFIDSAKSSANEWPAEIYNKLQTL